MVPYPPGGLFPAVGMHSEGEEVKLNLDAEWQYNELVLMAVDSGEEEWSRLHDVKLNGSVSGTKVYICWYKSRAIYPQINV